MAAEIYELAVSRQASEGFDSASRRLSFLVMGTTDDEEVRALVEAEIPATYLGSRLREYTIDPKGGGVWDVQVRYENKIGLTRFNFDTTGGTVKKLQANASRYYPSPVLPALIDFLNAVNVGENRKPDGVEVSIPQFSFTVQRTLASPIDGAYVQALYLLTGCVNTDLIELDIDGTELSFAAGELLFEGACGGQPGSEDWDITLKFRASQNKENMSFPSGSTTFEITSDLVTGSAIISGMLTTAALSVGDLLSANGIPPGTTIKTINGPTWLTMSAQATVTAAPVTITVSHRTQIAGVTKTGWEYLWFKYEEAPTPNNTAMISKPVQVCVDEVYSTAALAPLFA